jgi:hypothetical protein
MRRPIALAQQDESPFDVLELIRVARHRLILTAQNHGFMTFSDRTPVIEELLFRKLEAGLVIEIIAMHARAQPIPSGRPSPPADACAVWADYLRVPQFSEQLDRCWDTLARWHQRASVVATSRRLKIKGAYFLPLSISIVDPEDDHGFLVMSPRPAHEASASRPQFIITKQHERPIFNYYWHTVRNS